jgi:hypothetical protein
MRKFVCADPVPYGNMLSIDVTLKKEDFGVPSSLHYPKRLTSLVTR